MKNRHILEQLATLKKEDCIHDVFDFSVFHCGTAGCLAGELPGLDPDFYFVETFQSHRLRHKNIDHKLSTFVLEEYFDLGEEATAHIFVSGYQDTEKYGGKDLTDDATLEDVQENLRIFLELYPA